MKPPGPGDALLVVDVQNDSCRAARSASPAATRWCRRSTDCSARGAREACRSTSPATGIHRAIVRSPQGGPWPVHCVAGTLGAEFSPRLERRPDDVVVSKATQPDRDAYSALDGTPLAEELRA